MITRAAGVLSDILDERAVLIPPDGSEVVTLSRSGTAIWGLLVEPQTQTEIEAALRETYPSIDAATIAVDVAAFVAELHDGGFVEVAGG